MIKKEFNKKQVDKSGFPVNLNGEQIAISDGQGNIQLLLNSNFLANFPKNSCIKFNPKIKEESNKALDTLVNVLTENFIENIEGYFLLDLTDEVKKSRRLRTKEPLKIPKVQMYFDWIDNWLLYLGNIAPNIEFKLLFYFKYKEKIKKVFISLETGLKPSNAPESYIKFAKRWIEETDKNIDLERLSRQKKQSINPYVSSTSKKETPNTTKEQKKYLKDLFKNPDRDYDKIINLLIENEFISDNNDNTFDWVKVKNNGLEALKHICILGANLNTKKYFKKSSQKTIAEVLTNTINNNKISPQYYGQTIKEIEVNSEKTQEYYTSFYFIDTL